MSNPPTAGKLAASVPAVADMLDTSVRTIWRLIASKDLATVRCGRSVKVTLKSLEAFVQKGGSAT